MGIFLDIVIGYLIVFIAFLIVTQILIPLVRGSLLFPWFRRTAFTEKVKEAEYRLEELSDEEYLDDLNEEINRREANLRKEDK